MLLSPPKRGREEKVTALPRSAALAVRPLQRLQKQCFRSPGGKGTAMREALSRDEVVEAVDRAIEELLESAGVQAPPVDAIALAQRYLKMIVCLDRRQEQRGRAQRAAGRKQI